MGRLISTQLNGLIKREIIFVILTTVLSVLLLFLGIWGVIDSQTITGYALHYGTGESWIPEWLVSRTFGLLSLFSAFWPVITTFLNLYRSRDKEIPKYSIVLGTMLLLVASAAVAYVAEDNNPTYTVGKAISIHIDGPKEINANTPFVVKATVGIRPLEWEALKLPMGRVHARLQSGFAFPDDLQTWQEKKEIRAELSPQWTWVLTPDLERFGEQPILVEAQLFGDDDKLIVDADPVLVTINVKTPLGLPSWVGYGLILLGTISAIGIFGWLASIIARRFHTVPTADEKKPTAKRTSRKDGESKDA